MPLSPHYVANGPMVAWTVWLTMAEVPAEQVLAPTSADAARRLYHRLRCVGEVEVTVVSDRSGVGRIYRVTEAGCQYLDTAPARRRAA